MSDARPIFLFEPDARLMQQCATMIAEAGFQPITASSAEEATAALEANTLLTLLISFNPAGIELSQYVRGFTLCKAPLIALVDQYETEQEMALTRMDADGYLLRPFSASTLQSVLSFTQRITHLRQRLSSVEKELEDAAPQLRRIASAINTRTGFYQFEFIKDLLIVEVRRAKRYGYPLALLLVGLDELTSLNAVNQPNLPREITAGLAIAIAKSIRDIDLPIHFADDRILVLLPHTDRTGAEEVAKRIKRRIRRITYRGEELTAQLTASVGIAGIDAGESFTFSKLIKDATAALKAAQLKGGDKVMIRVPRPGLSS